MDASDRPLLPVALKLEEAFHVIQGMVAEIRTRRDAVRSLPADRQEQENQRLARDREQIGVLVKIVDGVADGVIEGQGGDAEEPPVVPQ